MNNRRIPATFRAAGRKRGQDEDVSQDRVCGIVITVKQTRYYITRATAIRVSHAHGGAA